MLVEEVVKLPTHTVLQQQIDAAGIVEHSVQPHDVHLVEVQLDLDLPCQLLLELLLPYRALLNHFQRKDAPRLLVPESPTFYLARWTRLNLPWPTTRPTAKSLSFTPLSFLSLDALVETVSFSSFFFISIHSLRHCAAFSNKSSFPMERFRVISFS